MVRGSSSSEEDAVDNEPSERLQRFVDFATAENARSKPNLRRQLLHYSLFHHLYNRLSEEQSVNESIHTNSTSSIEGLAEQYFLSYAQAARHRSHSPGKPDRTHSLHASLPPFPNSLRQDALHRIRSMFTHAYDSYMYNAYPAPELKPLSCAPGHFKLVELQGLTLIDTLDMLVIMNNFTEFARATERIKQLHANKSIFHVDQNVSVFETNIRVVGGLVSAHQLAQAYLNDKVAYDTVFGVDGNVLWDYHESSNELDTRDVDAAASSSFTCSSSHNIVGTASATCQSTLRSELTYLHSTTNATHDTCSARYWKYDGLFLDMAIDIGERLLPAFDTKTGIPYGTVNLLYGVPQGETTIASLAGGGTLTLEMELLSRYSGNDRFGKAAKRATRALFMRRHPSTQLYGKHIDIQSGHWTETLSGIGSNSDSFYEYLAKHYMLFPEDADFWTMLQSAYTGIYNHSRTGEWYPDVDMTTGTGHGGGHAHVRQVLESLMAFYPGLQVLLGEVTPAARTLNSMFIVREMLGFLPERFHFGLWKPDVGRGAAKHPLRPELLESCYFMHRATKDLTPPLRRRTARGDARQSTSSDGHSGWQWAADFALRKLDRMTRVYCGFASVHSISPETTGQIGAPLNEEYLYDEMPSFFLSETLKYLYLTFDDGNLLHTDDDRDWIFTTEAHPVHSMPKVELSKDVPKYMDQQVESLTRLLKDRLHRRRQQRKVGSYQGDFWSEQTTLQAYAKDLSVVERNAAMQRINIANESDFFFDKRHLVSSFVPVELTFGEHIDADFKQEQNLAHLALKNLGVGPGTLLRKACPNVHSSELLWMHALNGGATDYSETYMSVNSDDIRDHPNNFVSLSAMEALGVLGSGQISLGEFDVEAYPGGEGFSIQRVESGETIVATFLLDKSGFGNDLIMINAAVAEKDLHYHGEEDDEELKASKWRHLKSRLEMMLNKESSQGQQHQVSFANIIHDIKTMGDRKVIVADFNGNTFYCEVVVVEKIAVMNEDDDGDDVQHFVEEEEFLARYPCAPALFGPTSFAELIRTDGICIEKTAIAPAENDETGCKRADDTTTDGRVDFIESSGQDESCEHDAPTLACAQANAIRIVRRGDCSFYSKAINQRLRWDADGLIVINDYDSDLFVMSHSTEGEIVLSPEEIPCSILLSVDDGEDLLSKLIVDSNDENVHIVVRISVSRQPAIVNTDEIADEPYWPVVEAHANMLQIYAEGGWGIQAHRNMFAGGAVNKGEWKLQLVQHALSHSRTESDEVAHDDEMVDIDNESETTTDGFV
ncbi:hypothetical protein MPSEU_000909400 [Mayamaea pseudoterrestris]|nr:hypothetical protein MPSEU_000909400 [Mayamaea pseudoterrestris]